MQDILITQLNDMRKTLVRNIESIRALLSASASLGDLIDKLSRKDETSEEVPALNDAKRQIESTIKELLRHTEDLFDAYEKMAKNV